MSSKESIELFMQMIEEAKIIHPHMVQLIQVNLQSKPFEAYNRLVLMLEDVGIPLQVLNVVYYGDVSLYLYVHLSEG